MEKRLCTHSKQIKLMYNLKAIFGFSLKVTLLALLCAPIILFLLNFLVIKTEKIDFSSFLILLILSGLQNIIFIILLLCVGRFFYQWACKFFKYNHFLLFNGLYYLFLFFIFPVQSCIVFKCGFYKDLYPIVLISTIMISDISMRYINSKKLPPG